MALQGTIDSFPIVDVLQLLSGSAKTGRLELVGDRGRAALWVGEGQLVAGAAHGKPCGDPAQAVWELLRYSDGSFEFYDGDLPVGPGFEPAPVGQMIDRATHMQAEWDQIERRVPSMSHRVELAGHLPGAEVRLSAEDWAVVVVAGRGPSVAGLIDQVGLEEFEGCRRIAEMVDRGLLAVENAPAAVAPAEVQVVPEVQAAPEHPTEVRADPVAQEPVVTTSAQGAADAFAAMGGPPAGPAPSAVTADPVVQAVHDPAPTVAEPAAMVTPAPVAHPLAEPAPDAAAFPEHFPIDDLVAAPEPTWEPAAPGAVEAAFVERVAAGGAPTGTAFAPEAAVAGDPYPGDPYPGEAGWTQEPAPQGQPVGSTVQEGTYDPAYAPGPVQSAPGAPQAPQPPEDDVLAQIGRLSPKAAEAIAAALGDGGDRGPAV